MGNLKGVKVAVCVMKCTDLSKETVTILEIHFSYNTDISKEQSKENYLNRPLSKCSNYEE